MKNTVGWGTWGAKSVECPTLDFGSRHDLMVCEIGALCRALHWQSGACLGSSPSLSATLSLPLSLSLSQNKLKNKHLKNIVSCRRDSSKCYKTLIFFLQPI